MYQQQRGRDASCCNRLQQAILGRMTLQGDVEEWLEQLIAGGELQPGESLPSEHEVAGQRGVSRTTARLALKALVARGLAEEHPGVRRKVARQDTVDLSMIRPARLTAPGQEPAGLGADADLAAGLRVPGGKVTIEWVSARGPEVARRLQLPEDDEVVIRDMVRWAGGQRHSRARFAFAAGLARGTALVNQNDIPTGAVPFAVMLAGGGEPDRYDWDIETRGPTRAEQHQLQVGPSAHMLVVWRTVWLAGKAVCASEVIIIGSRGKLTASFDAR